MERLIGARVRGLTRTSADLGTGAERPRALIGLALLLAQPALAGSVGAAVTLAPSRAEVLYSAEADPDCSALSRLGDGELPLNVVRIRATVDGAAPEEVQYRWSLPSPNAGMLAADLDLGPSDRTAAIRGMCAEFGNACILTEDKLPFYNLPTILWVAPTCDVLPSRTTQDFAGGRVDIRLTARAGRRRLGRGVASVGYGRAAAVRLYVDGQDGVGKVSGIPSDIQPHLSAITDARGMTLPAVDGYEFDNGQGESTTVAPQPCTFQSLQMDACTGGLLYTQVGRFVAAVREKFTDGSALCDNATVRVLSADIRPRLRVTAMPRRTTYVPDDPGSGTVHLRVTLENASPRQGGGGILLIGANVLTCEAEVRVGGTSDTARHSFDLQHCSATVGQACEVDGDCRPPFCETCAVDEVCLTRSHCSETFTQNCAHDSDCQAPRCADCRDDESCVHVLATPAIVVGIGESVDLVDEMVPVANVFPNVARIRELWTVNTFNAGTAEDKLSYRIRGRPLVAPAP